MPKTFLRKEPRRVHFGIVLKPLVHKHTKRSKNKIYIQLLREVQMVHYCLNEADISTYGTSSNGRIIFIDILPQNGSCYTSGGWKLLSLAHYCLTHKFILKRYSLLGSNYLISKQQVSLTWAFAVDPSSPLSISTVDRTHPTS